MKFKRMRQKAAAVLAASLLAASISPIAEPVHAAVPKLDTIRVGLFLESGNLKSTVQTVTLASSKGLALTMQTDAASTPWPNDWIVPGTVRIAADQYTVKLMETQDYAKAAALYAAIKTPYPASGITRTERSGKPVYSVNVPGYTSKEAAQSALAALSALPAVSALTEKPALEGPLHLNAGTFGTLAEAEQQRTLLAQAGITGDIAITQQTGGGLEFSVWIGSAADNAGLQAVQTEALKQLPALQLKAVDSAKPYVVKRDDATSSADGKAAALFLISPSGLKLSTTAKEGEVTVKERFNRTYRGAIEAAVYNGKLAVINELPFEQYLYSVVSEEMGKGWPQEALKAQAVAARTYALKSGVKYQIAHVSDTTMDQAFDGDEDADSIKAVDATKGEVLLYKGVLISALFSSNAGGMSSSGADVWGNVVPYLKTAPSPDDGAAKNRAIWKRVALPDGQAAYIHSSYLKDTGRLNPVGLPIYQITEDGVNARTAPYVDNTRNPAVAKLSAGDLVAAFAEVQESNTYSWIRGPYTQAGLLEEMNAFLKEEDRIPGPLTSLQITKRGDSGRVTELTANGKIVKVGSPDAYRSAFGGLPSSRFEIERSGGYTIQGANGSAASSTGSALYALTASGQQQAVGAGYFVLNGNGKVSYGSKETQFTFTGTGYGHGLGMSQWGARGLAEIGYDYKKILSTYYQGVTLTKE